MEVDPFWAFADKSRKQTSYLTHGYHRYPAKFIPQIVSSLVERYTREGELVLDPFGGCGTTLVESKVMGRPSVGIDINPVACLITKAKITPVDPEKLESLFGRLLSAFDRYSERSRIKVPEHPRLDYWFEPQQKRKLAYLFSEISGLKDQNARDFFYCGFSNILKNCSLWLQKSNKPTRDLNKDPAEPFEAFSRQIRRMLRGHREFINLLKENGFGDVSCNIYCADARKTPVKAGKVSLIVTSPPYVTSYEYADLHQLTALWFEYTRDLSDFRRRFIGTSYNSKTALCLNSPLAQIITSQLLSKDKKTAQEVATYFGEMNQAFKEMKRVLKKGDRTCGNTCLKGVDILNAEVFTEQLQRLGFEIDEIIKREIPSKNLPSIRDKKTGRFASSTDKNRTYAYPTEHILIMQKL